MYICEEYAKRNNIILENIKYCVFSIFQLKNSVVEALDIYSL